MTAPEMASRVTAGWVKVTVGEPIRVTVYALTDPGKLTDAVPEYVPPTPSGHSTTAEIGAPFASGVIAPANNWLGSRASCNSAASRSSSS